MIKIVVLLLVIFALSSQLSVTPSNKITPIECPDGTKLQAKQGYVAKSNGCGGSKYQVKVGNAVNPFTDNFTPCCNAHDFCYKTCDLSGNNRDAFEKCNSEFKSCLNSKCKKLNIIKEALCKPYAAAYSTFVSDFGGPFYTEDQNLVCECK